MKRPTPISMKTKTRTAMIIEAGTTEFNPPSDSELFLR
jgi:hypothetical protein